MDVLTRLIAEKLQCEEAIAEKQRLELKGAGLQVLHVVLKAQDGL